jgi:hypothetical protein
MIGHIVSRVIFLQHNTNDGIIGLSSCRKCSERPAQYSDKEKSNCDHQSQPCSDSVAVVTSTDGVFGSDKSLGALDFLAGAGVQDLDLQSQVGMR